jgi:hypothetical protein
MQENNYNLSYDNNNSNNFNNKYSDFNAKARGWAEHSNRNYLDSAINKPKLFEPVNSSQNSIHKEDFHMTKDGIQNLKSRIFESSKSNYYVEPNNIQHNKPHHFSNQTHHYYENQVDDNEVNNINRVSKIKLNKLSSHENYLFNNKNSMNAIVNSSNDFNQKYNQSYFDDSIATSDL